MTPKRETFTSNFGLLMTMIGVAVGLGNVWRFPYMVGKFGGASFVLFYLLAVFFIGIPALMAEWIFLYLKLEILWTAQEINFPETGQKCNLQVCLLQQESLQE